MAYESPISVWWSDTKIEQLKDEYDNVIVKAVQNCYPQVDKDELIKALRYDREQYEKGYRDGRLYQPPVLTNGDRIRAMSDEELAEWLAEVLFHCSNTICDERCPMYKCCCDQPSDNILDWLKEATDG